MNKIHLIFIIALLVISCQNKDLCPTCPNADTQPVHLVINWQANQVKPSQGMRANIFSLNNMPEYGIEDVSTEGAVLYLPLKSEVKTFCYSYHGNNIYFRNESNINLIEAYTAAATRATYTKSFPNENTYTQPSSVFYVGTNEKFEVVPSIEPLVLDVWVENIVKTYTFEVRNVKGARFISSTRGAIAGMSSSVFLATMTLSPSPATLLFSAATNKTENKIEGVFYTFGHQPSVPNIFTIEILYPSATGGILQKSWDVSSQVNVEGNYHIIIDDADIDIPDNGGGDGGEVDSGFEVDVGEWGNETTILN